MKDGYLKVILGSMFSGKTTELIKEYNRHIACGFECCMINHISDTRYGNKSNETSTHNKVVVKSVKYSNLDNFFTSKDVDIQKIIQNTKVWFINEGQFFPDLYKWIDHLVNKKNCKVYVCGLDGDFERRKFGSILDIIPLCDDLIKLKAICQECKKDGIFTHRLTDEITQTVIGSDNYISLCRVCYNSRNCIA